MCNVATFQVSYPKQEVGEGLGTSPGYLGMNEVKLHVHIVLPTNDMNGNSENIQQNCYAFFVSGI